MSALYVTPDSIRSEMDEAPQEYGLNPAQAEALAALDNDTISRAITPSDDLIEAMDRLQRATIAKLTARPEVQNARPAPTYTQVITVRDAAARYVAAQETARAFEATDTSGLSDPVYALEVNEYGDGYEVDLVDRHGMVLWSISAADGLDLHVALDPSNPVLDEGQAPSGEVRPFVLVSDLAKAEGEARAALDEALTALVR